MNKLVASALATLAFTSIASAQKAEKPEWNQQIIEDLLKNEKAVKNYGTVGYPLADELDPGWECKQGSNLYDFSYGLYEQEVLGNEFNVGFGGSVNLVNEPTKVGAEVVLGPQVEFFNDTFRPLDVTISAVTKDDGENVLELAVNGFGHTLVTQPITQSYSPISRQEYFGYSLPVPTPDPNPYTIGGSEGNWSWNAEARIVGHVGALLSFRVAPNGVEAHALASAVAWADASVSASYGDTTLAELTGRIDGINLFYAGRAMMLPQSGGGWVADAASELAIKNMMGAYIAITDVPLVPDYDIIRLDPKSHIKDAFYSCKFENKMDPKKFKDPKTGETKKGETPPVKKG